MEPIDMGLLICVSGSRASGAAPASIAHAMPQHYGKRGAGSDGEANEEAKDKKEPVSGHGAHPAAERQVAPSVEQRALRRALRSRRRGCAR